MVIVLCPLCGGREAQRLFEAQEFILHRKPYTLARCKDCSHVFVNPSPGAEELEAYYAELENAHSLAPCMALKSSENVPAEQEKINLLEALDLINRPGAILDISLTDERFLLAMEGVGWHCVGVELFGQARSHFDRPGQFQVLSGLDSLSQVEPEQFDLVTFWNVLEHLSDPIGMLRLARRVLRPEGRIVVAVPNAAGLSSRIFGPYWYAVSPPSHLQQFSPRSLGLAFCESGMLIDEVRGFDAQRMRILWTESVSEMIDAVPSKWYGDALKVGLRLFRKGMVITAPVLLWAEQALGLNGSIVATGKRNPLVDASQIEFNNSVSSPLENSLKDQQLMQPT